MYPNIYCKNKHYGNYNYYNYMGLPSELKISHMQEPITVHHALHALAPIFEPKRGHVEQLIQDVINNSNNNNINNNIDVKSATSSSSTDINDDNSTNVTADEQKKEQKEQQQQEEQQEQQQEEQQEQQQDGEEEEVEEEEKETQLIEETNTEEPCTYSNEALFYFDYAGGRAIVGYHPLNHIWTLWYLETDRSKTWEEMQNEISSVDNVEDFWRLYNHIKLPSELKIGCDYSLFRKGIRPMWEDEGNRNGGRWIITLPRVCPKIELDTIWLDTVLTIIGETFDYSSIICGAVVNIRIKSHRVSVWTTHADDDNAVLTIGYQLRDTLRLHPFQLQYQLHKDTMTRNSNAIIPRHII